MKLKKLSVNRVKLFKNRLVSTSNGNIYFISCITKHTDYALDVILISSPNEYASSTEIYTIDLMYFKEQYLEEHISDSNISQKVDVYSLTPEQLKDYKWYLRKYPELRLDLCD